MPYTTNAWSHFDWRFDTLPTHLRQQMWMQIEAQVESFEMYIVALDTTLSISRHRAPNMPYTTNAWSHFDRRFDTLPTHLRRQMWMQIEAQVESFEMFIVALDTTLSISRHRAPNMPYTTNAWSHFDRRFDTLPTHLRGQMWMQIEAQVESFEMYIVALDTTFSISRHRAPNMLYTTNAWSHFDRRFDTLPTHSISFPDL